MGDCPQTCMNKLRAAPLLRTLTNHVVVCYRPTLPLGVTQSLGHLGLLLQFTHSGVNCAIMFFDDRHLYSVIPVDLTAAICSKQAGKSWFMHIGGQYILSNISVLRED